MPGPAEPDWDPSLGQPCNSQALWAPLPVHSICISEQSCVNAIILEMHQVCRLQWSQPGPSKHQAMLETGFARDGRWTLGQPGSSWGQEWAIWSTLRALSPHRIRSRPREPLGQLHVLKEIDKTKVELSSAPPHPSLSPWIKP